MVPTPSGFNELPNQEIEAAERALAKSLETCVETAAAYGLVDGHERRLHPRPDAMERLRSCVGQYTRALRTIGEPPERVLVRLKEILHAAVKEPLKDHVVADAAIRWCIEAYFAEE